LPSKAAGGLLLSTNTFDLEEPVSEQAQPAGFVVVDPQGSVFSLLRALELPVALWRTVRAPGENDVPSTNVILYVAEDRPAWEEIREIGRSWPTIVVAVRASAADASDALRVGAFGYLDLKIPAEGLRRTLLGALRGEPAFSREVMGRWLREGQAIPRPGHDTRTERLTARQREIIGLIAAGATDKEVGAALGIRTATAQKHVANLLRRLGVPNRAAAVGLLIKDGQRFPPVPARGKRRR
jgi:DNA-binding NarL/FixJ family response regulator